MGRVSLLTLLKTGTFEGSGHPDTWTVRATFYGPSRFQRQPDICHIPAWSSPSGVQLLGSRIRGTGPLSWAHTTASDYSLRLNATLLDEMSGGPIAQLITIPS